MKEIVILLLTVSSFVFLIDGANAQIGTRFPSERKVIRDPVTGTVLTFLTTASKGDSKIYPTHNQWTSDGEWLIFRSSRVQGEAMAVNEKTGDLVQVTEGGYTGMLNVARKSMKLHFMRKSGSGNTIQIIEVDLDKLLTDSKANKLKQANIYQRVCGTTPEGMDAGGDMAIDADENRAYFRVGREEAARHLASGVKIESSFGPRNMGAGPSGIATMDLKTGDIRYVISVPFQVGHIQTNPWVTGEIVFCWETGGKSPQRTWTVKSDGTGLRPLYPEAPYEWVTHEAVISKDEVAFAILGHRPIKIDNKTSGDSSTISDPVNPGQEKGWGSCGTREKPSGLGSVNFRTRQMEIVGQTGSGSGLWHVHGSADGRWAVADDFSRSIYLIDRHTKEMILLSTGHKQTAADHPHPTFNADGTKIQIQSAMLSEDDKAMNICIVPVPEAWLRRAYK